MRSCTPGSSGFVPQAGGGARGRRPVLAHDPIQPPSVFGCHHCDALDEYPGRVGIGASRNGSRPTRTGSDGAGMDGTLV